MRDDYTEEHKLDDYMNSKETIGEPLKKENIIFAMDGVTGISEIIKKYEINKILKKYR